MGTKQTRPRAERQSSRKTRARGDENCLLCSQLGGVSQNPRAWGRNVRSGRYRLPFPAKPARVGTKRNFTTFSTVQQCKTRARGDETWAALSLSYPAGKTRARGDETELLFVWPLLHPQNPRAWGRNPVSTVRSCFHNHKPARVGTKHTVTGNFAGNGTTNPRAWGQNTHRQHLEIGHHHKPARVGTKPNAVVAIRVLSSQTRARGDETFEKKSLFIGPSTNPRAWGRNLAGTDFFAPDDHKPARVGTKLGSGRGISAGQGTNPRAWGRNAWPECWLPAEPHKPARVGTKHNSTLLAIERCPQTRARGDETCAKAAIRFRSFHKPARVGTKHECYMQAKIDNPRAWGRNVSRMGIRWICAR